MGKIDVYETYRCSKARTYGGQEVERMDQVSEEVLGRMERKFEKRRRPGVCKVKRSDENLIADAEKCALTDQSRQYWRNSQNVKNLVVGNNAETRPPL